MVALPLPQSGTKDRKHLNDSLILLDSLVNASLITNRLNATLCAKKALKVASALGTPDARVRAMNLMGMTFTNLQNDSGYYYYSQALTMAVSFGLKERQAHLYYNIAMLYVLALDYKNGMTYLDSALVTAGVAGEYSVISDVYNILGNINYAVDDKPGAIRMYNMAYKVSKEHSFYLQMGTALGNLAEFEKDDKTYIKNLQDAVGMLKKSYGNEKEIASFYNNIGLRQTSPDSALFYYRLALQTLNNGRIPEVEILTYNNMAYAFLDKGDLSSSESCLAGHAIPLALQENNQDLLSTLYDTYADVLVAKGKDREAVGFMKKAVTAREVADREAAAGQVRLLAAILDLKDKEIVIRTRENEILVANSALTRTRVLLIFAILCIAGLVFIVLWVRQKSIAKLREQQIGSAKRIIAMEEAEKEKLSGELHDITGQLMLGVLSQVEQFDFSEKRKKIELKERISGLGSRIRQISHRIGSSHMEDLSFEELIRGLCEDMEAFTGIPVGIEIDIRGSIVPLGDCLLHIYRITQELLTNAGKYADGARVEISMKVYDGKFDMLYNDNGPGFSDQGTGRHGIGIMNIMERAKLLGGNAAVNSIPGQGVSWEISIPLTGRKTWSKN
ncbi:MAG: ATP-binding protein [bacterium]